MSDNINCDQEADTNLDGESFDEAFARWCGFRGGEYFQDLDALGLARDHDKLPRMQKNRIAHDLDIIADFAAAALPEEKRIRRQELRKQRWAMRLVKIGMGQEITGRESTENLLRLQPSDRIKAAQRIWGEACLDAFLTGDFEVFKSLWYAAKAYDRGEDRTKAAQVIEVAWRLRCDLNRDPKKTEVKQECKEIGIELSDWRKIWKNARLTFLPE
jgi:hypothetical protein